MITAPDPRDEERRLEQLLRYDILDTPPEEAFDRLTRLASTLLDAPIALISLLDRERQWFKSRVGLAATETPRDIAFCAHALSSEDVLVVEDATADRRFVDNPLVTGEPFIRFYAGAPLTMDGGHVLGTLCVIDHRPREMNERDRNVLRDLARIAVDQLRLRRSIDQLKANQVRIEAELDQARETLAGLLPTQASLETLKAQIGIDVGGVIVPCSEIGGDFWSAGTDGSVLMLFVADVSGHGIASAVQASTIYCVLHPLPPFIDDLGRMQSHLDTRLGEFGALSGSHTAAAYFLIDPRSRTIRHFGAGAPDAMLISVGGTRRRLSGAGLPYGLRRGERRAEHTTPYRSGDLLLTFSDGVIETPNAAGKFLDEDDVHMLLAGNLDLPMNQVVRRATDRFIDWCGGAITDDITIVCARLP